MSDLEAPFWETKSLTEMTPQEWESLCDGCGLCCLIRLEDEDSGDIIPTRVHCKRLNAKTCRCRDYENRHQFVPDCIKLTPHNIEDLLWMPKSCAYRRLFEGKPLPNWHPLITKDPESVHKAGVSMRGKTVSEDKLHSPDDALDYMSIDLNADRSDFRY